MTSDFADSALTSQTERVIRVATLAASAALLLTACTQTATSDPSAAPGKPKDFCHAMSAAADVAPPAATALDELFITIDEMAAGASEGDIDNLHAAGEATVTTSQTYAAALTAAAAMAPDALAIDITTLADYWNLYALGLGQIAQDAPSYGSLIDQSTALATSEQASALIAEQPAAQERVNSGYLSECAG